jgi:hypothetical protein
MQSRGIYCKHSEGTVLSLQVTCSDCSGSDPYFNTPILHIGLGLGHILNNIKIQQKKKHRVHGLNVHLKFALELQHG